MHLISLARIEQASEQQTNRLELTGRRQGDLELGRDSRLGPRWCEPRRGIGNRCNVGVVREVGARERNRNRTTAKRQMTMDDPRESLVWTVKPRVPDAGRHHPVSDRQDRPSWEWAGLKKLGR